MMINFPPRILGIGHGKKAIPMKGFIRQRMFVACMSYGLAVVCAAQVATADELTARGLNRLDDRLWSESAARHLLFRAGFGGSAEEVRRLYDLGLEGAVAQLVHFEDLPELTLAPPTPPQLEVAREQLRQMTEQERMEVLNRFRRLEREYLQNVRIWWVRRMVATERPLEEKLTLFWHGHFASDYRTVERPEAMYRQNELFRRHAAGNFGRLLHGVVRDPAMLRYLDNHRNVAGRPNENLARELMELFTMGEGNGYTERDIAEGARALTGYSFQREDVSFVFLPRLHDRNSKTIFGQTGRWDGDQFADLILKQPATARFIARKLFVYFVHDQPSEEMIDALASQLREHDYDLKPLLKTLFTSAEFYSSAARGRQIKSPAELVIGTVRTLQINAEPNALLQAMRGMGQELFNPPNVRGWEGGAAWINSNSLFARQNFVAGLLISDQANRDEFRRRDSMMVRPTATAVDWASRLEPEGISTPEAIVDYFARLMLAVPLPDEKRAQLTAALTDLPEATAWGTQRRAVNRQVARMLVLMMTLPEYQLN